jgi:hypothetical protein
MRSILAVLLVSLLAACTARVTPPRVELESGPLISVGKGGSFCPPGQAKKGNC